MKGKKNSSRDTTKMYSGYLQDMKRIKEENSVEHTDKYIKVPCKILISSTTRYGHDTLFEVTKLDTVIFI